MRTSFSFFVFHFKFELFMAKIKNKTKLKIEKRKRIHRRIRAKIIGTEQKPRLYVFRSNKHIYCQIIDDKKAITLVSACDKEIKRLDLRENEKTKFFSKKVAIAYLVGNLIAKKALDKKIKKIVFDKSWYKYHGRIKAVADGARIGGLKF